MMHGQKSIKFTTQFQAQRVNAISPLQMQTDTNI